MRTAALRFREERKNIVLQSAKGSISTNMAPCRHAGALFARQCSTIEPKEYFVAQSASRKHGAGRVATAELVIPKRKTHLESVEIVGSVIGIGRHQSGCGCGVENLKRLLKSCQCGKCGAETMAFVKSV